MKKIIAALLVFSTAAWAQQNPTIIYGASENAPNSDDEYLLIQPDNTTNPLGKPIVDDSQIQTPDIDGVQNQITPTNTYENSENLPDHNPLFAPTDHTAPIIDQSAEQNPQPFSESIPQQQNQIDNSLYQGGNRIYDVQSYPIEDVKTITEPNIQPTVSTYPQY